jgi:mono/diheme cytochrome c family protein
MSRAAALLFAPAWLAAAALVHAGPGAEVRRGEQIARGQCSACHIVAQHQEYPPLLEQPGPSFQSIADRPDSTEKSLHRFVAATHWDQKSVPFTMPNPELSSQDMRAVIRYILSLRGH